MDSVDSNNQSTQVPRKKSLWIIVLAVVLIAGLLTGTFFVYKKFFVKKSAVEAEVGKIKPINPTFDMIHGKSVQVTVKDGGKISVFNENKVGMVVDIPAGAVEKDIEIKVIPIKDKDKDVIPGVMIMPENIQFKKPVKLAFDFSLSNMKNDNAPENAMGTNSRQSGSSHIYRYNTVSTSLMPALVNRSAEVKTLLLADIISGGIYNYIIDDKNEVTRSKYALTFSKQTVDVVLESANTLFANKEKISGKEKELLQNAIKRVKADKSPNVLELNAALSAEASLSGKKVGLGIKTIHAADTYSGYLDARCKDTTTSADELLSVWKTAQLGGYDAEAENCKTRIQNIVAERVNKLLDQPDPTYIDLLKAQQDAILIGLEDKFTDAIVKKRHDKAVREARELLKDPSVDPRIIAIALQNVFLFADNETALQESLSERMNSGLGADVQRVLGDPNASKQDIMQALAKNDVAGGGEEAKKQLEEKLKNAKDGTDPKVDESSSEEAMEELPAFDWGIVGVAFLQMMGVEDFSEAGLKSWSDQKIEEFEEMKEFTIGLCQFTEELSGQSLACDQKASEIDNAIDQFESEMDDYAEKIGSVQALPEEEIDDSYDGSNEESISGSCISQTEANQIDPQGELGYTICPEDGSADDNEASTTDNADDSVSTDSGADDSSSDEPVSDDASANEE